MDTNLAAWMIGGGPRIEDPHTVRDREQLHAFRESQRVADHDRQGLVGRLRQVIARRPADADLVCWPA